jgi:hypothetical protein
MGIRGRIPILSEAYSNDPFPRRIASTYAFLREILSLAAEERVAVKRVVAASAQWHPDSIGLHSVLAPPSRQEVIAELTSADGDGSHGFARRRRSGTYRRIMMPVFDRFVADRSTPRPAGYLLPPQHSPLVALLRIEGVVVSRLAAPWSGSVEAFTVDTVTVAPFLFEGHRAVGVAGHWASRPAELSAGWYYISTAQRLGVLAAVLLEPESEDGFSTWNYLDRDLRSHAEAPVLRVRLEPAVPRTLLGPGE